jgi:uncharacterized OsmC-like protein
MAIKIVHHQENYGSVYATLRGAIEISHDVEIVEG